MAKEKDKRNKTVNQFEEHLQPDKKEKKNDCPPYLDLVRPLIPA